MAFLTTKRLVVWSALADFPGGERHPEKPREAHFHICSHTQWHQFSNVRSFWGKTRVSRPCFLCLLWWGSVGLRGGDGVSFSIRLELDTYSNSLQIHPFPPGHQWAVLFLAGGCGMLKQATCQEDRGKGTAHSAGTNLTPPK